MHPNDNLDERRRTCRDIVTGPQGLRGNSDNGEAGIAMTMQGAMATMTGHQPHGPTPIDAILDAARHHLGMEIAFAARYVDGRRQFTHIRTDLPVPQRPGDSEPNEDTFCWNVLQGNLPELIHDAADHPLAQTLPITAALPVGRHMDVPLRLKDGSVYGSFCCLGRTPDRSLTERDLATLRAFAELAAVQIQREVDDGASQAALVARLRDAIDAGQPTILLQPIYRLADDRPIGVEALARFPDASVRPPSDWFNEAAGIGLGAEIELAAVRAALATLPFVPAPAYLSINVSPAVAASPALHRLLADVEPGRILLEVTEHAAIADCVALKHALAPLAGRTRIAIDDVGVGYAGLRHILELQPDVLKLDLSLTRDVDQDQAKRALIGAMVQFAGEIGADIVAEGVEREGERATLQALGIRYVQGWLFSRAVPPVVASRLLIGATELDAAPRRRRAAA